MIGATFDGFKVLKGLGKGNMGEVYLGLQESLERHVALKIIYTSEETSSQVLTRFLQEAKLTASIQHPNVVSIYSTARYEKFAYIAMEYVQGETLDFYIEQQRFTEEKAYEILLQLCRGLYAASQQKIIHRDIKPGNILIAQNQGIAKLVDFGLCKKIEDEDWKMTQKGAILGTPGYISPEQASGSTLDFRSDIYSLGATFYHLLTGQPLFLGKSVLDILCKHKYEEPPHPWEHDPQLKLESSYILAKMLYKKPEDRYQSYQEIFQDIEALLHHQPLIYASKKDMHQVYRANDQLKFSRSQNTTRRLLRTLKKWVTTGSEDKKKPLDEVSFNPPIKANQIVVSLSESEEPIKDTLALDKNWVAPTLPTPPPLSSEASSFSKETLPLDTTSLAQIDSKVETSPFFSNVKEPTSMNLNLPATLPSEEVEALYQEFRSLHRSQKASSQWDFQKRCYAFGHFLLDQHFLNENQLKILLLQHKKENRVLGEIAIEEKLLTSDQLQNILKVQRRLHKNFGQIATQMGYLKFEQLSYLLDLQKKYYIGLKEIILYENLLDPAILELAEGRFNQEYEKLEYKE